MIDKKPDYFTSGKGMPYSAHEPAGAKTNAARTKPMEIDLNKLNQPGVGPVDYDELQRGRILPRLTTEKLGQVSGDID